MKHYFITYQATNKQGSISIWNQVIKGTPMGFISDVCHTEEKWRNNYHNFVVINTCEITALEWDYWNGKF